jgi:hypothetical protein
MNRYLRQGAFWGVLATLSASAVRGEDGGQAVQIGGEAARGATGLADRFEVGLGLHFMPVGWFDLADYANRDFRAYPALGFAPFVDYRLSRYIGVGLSPEVTLNVIPNRDNYSVGEMLTFDVRLQARYPNQGPLEPYAIATGGYSVIWRAEGSAAHGPAVGVSLGLRLRFARRHAVFLEASYQKGFQRVDGGAYGSSYLVTGAGWQVGL